MRSRRDALFCAAGVTGFALLCWRFGWHDLGQAIGHVRPAFLCAYVGVGLAAVLGWCWRWRLIVAALAAPPPLSRLLAARLAGDAVGAVVPSARLAGEPVRMAALQANGLDGPRATAAVAIDRALEAIGNMLCGITYTSVFVATHAAPRADATAFLGALVLLLGALVLFLEMLRRGASPFAPLYSPVLQRAIPRLTAWTAGLRAVEEHLTVFMQAHWRTFLGGLLMSLAIEAAFILELRLLLGGFGIALPLPTLLMVIVGTGIARAAPSPAGIGALEATQVGVLMLAGGGSGLGFVVGVVMRLHETLWTATGLCALALLGIASRRLPVARRLAA